MEKLFNHISASKDQVYDYQTSKTLAQHLIDIQASKAEEEYSGVSYNLGEIYKQLTIEEDVGKGLAHFNIRPEGVI